MILKGHAGLNMSFIGALPKAHVDVHPAKYAPIGVNQSQILVKVKAIGWLTSSKLPI